MANKNKRVVRYKSKLNLNAGIVIFGLISIYLIINIFSYLSTDRTAYYEVISGSNAENINRTYTGIALRNEKIVCSKTSGYVDYYVREGSRISKNTTLYSLNSSGNLNDIIKKMNKKSSNLTDENISALKNILYEYSNDYDDMNFSKVYDFKSILKGTVIDLINMNSLEKIAKKSGNKYAINKSEVAGIILYRVDEFENIKPKDLKSKYFDKSQYAVARFSSGDKIDKGTPLYKAITDEEWSIAIQLSNADVKKYKKTNGIKIKFPKDNLVTTANLKIVNGKDKKPYGIITLSKYAIRYATDRYVDIQIMDNVTSGLKIPKTALVTKSLYLIPRNFGTEGGDSNDIAFNRQVKSEGKITNEFYYPTIAYSDKKNYYVSTTLFEQGEILTAPDSHDTYIVSKTQKFVGVYNINNGYTVFVRVNILSETDEYYIVESGDTYGLVLYDRIVLDSSTVKENQIIFQ